MLSWWLPGLVLGFAILVTELYPTIFLLAPQDRQLAPSWGRLALTGPSLGKR